MSPPNNPPSADRLATPGESRVLVEQLSRSEIYQDYEAAFSEASGLPLALRPLDFYGSALSGKTKENPFCALMAKSNKSCAACLCLQAELETKAQMEPQSLRCFAGMRDSLIPIRVGQKLIAFLQTGQILLHQPSEREFADIAQRLLSWGSQVDLKSTEEAFFQTKVLKPKQYHAFVSMLNTFAEHLASVSNQLAIKDQPSTIGAVAKARKYIGENYSHALSLNDAAKTINTSARYFCKIFKKATGMTFVEYVNRLRIEKAKNLLLNPNKRVSEVAFEVGFDSLSQFNRSFKKYVGKTPSAHRETIRI